MKQSSPQACSVCLKQKYILRSNLESLLRDNIISTSEQSFINNSLMIFYLGHAPVFNQWRQSIHHLSKLLFERYCSNSKHYKSRLWKTCNNKYQTNVCVVWFWFYFQNDSQIRTIGMSRSRIFLPSTHQSTLRLSISRNRVTIR